MKKISTFAIVLFSVITTYAQSDTISVMQYNLMMYGNYFSDCTTTTNNVDDKDPLLTTITSYVKPDIFTVNELGISMFGGKNIYGERILNDILNINGITSYKKALHTGPSGQYIGNMIFYNSDKLTLENQETISSDLDGNGLVRLIDIYKLSHTINGEKIYLTCIVGHLKAGNLIENENARTKAAASIMNYLDQIGVKGNRLLMGDFNLYSSSEGAFQNFTNSINQDVVFFDPINQIGDWNNNSSFKKYHTQSTNTTSGGCQASGGMDDRFDWIMATQPIIDNTMGIKYIPNSYKGIGQDGSFFNSSLNTTTNSSVPAYVAEALAVMSDHIPVFLKLEVTPLANSIKELENSITIKYNNPFSDQLYIRLLENDFTTYNYSLYNISGQEIISNTTFNSSQTTVNTNNLPTGVYILNINSNKGNYKYKVVKM